MRYFFNFILILTPLAAFSQSQAFEEKKLAATVGLMLRSRELVGNGRYTGFGLNDQTKLGANFGAAYTLTPQIKLGYHASLRYGAIYYNQDAFEIEKELIVDHSFQVLYKLSGASARVGKYLGLGYSVINTNKEYAVQDIGTGNVYHFDLQHSTIDVLASFSYKRYHLEPKLMFNYTDEYQYHPGEKQLRMMIGLRLYYALGVLSPFQKPQE